MNCLTSSDRSRRSATAAAGTWRRAAHERFDHVLQRFAMASAAGASADMDGADTGSDTARWRQFLAVQLPVDRPLWNDNTTWLVIVVATLQDFAPAADEAILWASFEVRDEQRGHRDNANRNEPASPAAAQQLAVVAGRRTPRTAPISPRRWQRKLRGILSHSALRVSRYRRQRM